MAVIRLLDEAGVAPLEGWVLDESNAYRQVAVRPDHRSFGVVGMPGV